MSYRKTTFGPNRGLLLLLVAQLVLSEDFMQPTQQLFPKEHNTEEYVKQTRDIYPIDANMEAKTMVVKESTTLESKHIDTKPAQTTTLPMVTLGPTKEQLHSPSGEEKQLEEEVLQSKERETTFKPIFRPKPTEDRLRDPVMELQGLEKSGSDDFCRCRGGRFLNISFANAACHEEVEAWCPDDGGKLSLTCGPHGMWEFHTWNTTRCQNSAIAQIYAYWEENKVNMTHAQKVWKVASLTEYLKDATEDYYFLGRKDLTLVVNLLHEWSNVMARNPCRNPDLAMCSKAYYTSKNALEENQANTASKALCILSALEKLNIITRGYIPKLQEAIGELMQSIALWASTLTTVVSEDGNDVTQALGFNCLDVVNNESKLSFPPPESADTQDPAECQKSPFEDDVRKLWGFAMPPPPDVKPDDSKPPPPRVPPGTVRIQASSFAQKSDCRGDAENSGGKNSFTSLVVSLSTNYGLYALDGRVAQMLQQTGEVLRAANATLWSDILTINIGDSKPWPRGANLSEPMEFDLTPSSDVNETSKLTDEATPVCAFWYVDEGVWRTDGCVTLGTNADGSVTCSCDHATNFAVLMSVDGSYAGNDNGEDNNEGNSIDDPTISEENVKALEIIMYIGLVVSLVCYSATIWTYSYHHSLLTEPKVFLLHICANLMVGEATFVLGVFTSSDRWDSPGACTTLGAISHFSLLTAFFWTLVDALYIHDIFTHAMEAFTRTYPNVYKLSVFCYGSSFAVVAITSAVLHPAYRQDDGHCFLSASDGGIWAFVGPVIAIICCNVFLFLRIMRVIMGAEVNNPGGTTESEQKRNAQRVKNRRTFRASVSFFFLLGIGWLFGMLAFGDMTLVFQYVFSIMLILQGLCIFMFQCLLDPAARAAWLGDSSTGSSRQDMIHATEMVVTVTSPEA
eukprot:m.45991 g.45991  ORF g.45991 m.45991 type:complete len:910 (+) comp10321_c0_seq1:297-3026(+)